MERKISVVDYKRVLNLVLDGRLLILWIRNFARTNVLVHVLNLILDGRLLILTDPVEIEKHIRVSGFKPCFRWSAPYTPIF